MYEAHVCQCQTEKTAESEGEDFLFLTGKSAAGVDSVTNEYK